MKQYNLKIDVKLFHIYTIAFILFQYENDFDVNSGDTDKEASDDSDLTLTLKVCKTTQAILS